jgi:hypothetical protein
MPVSYRELQAPSFIDTTPLETGNSEAAASLQRAFKTFEGALSDVGAPLQQRQMERNAQAGAEAGASGKPELKEGWKSLTAFGEAYNNSALRSYAIKAESDAEDQAARLEVEAQNDPEKFAATFSAVRDETLKQAPPQARGTLATIYAQRLGAGVARLRTAQTTDQNNLARADTKEGVDRSVDRIANGYASDDPVQYDLAEQEQAKLRMLIDGAYNTQTITAAERNTLLKNTQQQIVSQTVRARFRKTLESPYSNPVDFIEKVKKENLTNEALSPKEEEALVDQLMGELREHNALMSAKYGSDNAEVKARYEQGDREATAALFSGELTTSKLRDMVVQQRLDPGRATSLANELAGGGVATDDPKEAAHVRTNLLRYTEEEIETNSKLTWTTRAELMLKRREDEAGWKGTQAAREGDARIERALGILPGTMVQMLSEEEREALDRAKTAWYNEIDKLPPAERQASVIAVAEEVAGTYIRKNKAVFAQSLRRAKENYIQRNGHMIKAGEKTKQQYEARLRQFDTDIATAEAEAARK